MAKAKRAKYVSKGQRRNSKLAKPQLKEVTGNWETSMQVAVRKALGLS